MCLEILQFYKYLRAILIIAVTGQLAGGPRLLPESIPVLFTVMATAMYRLMKNTFLPVVPTVYEHGFHDDLVPDLPLPV